MTDTLKAPSTDQPPPLLENELLNAIIWAIAAEIKANMPDDVTSDHGWLYDEETGLPV